MNRFWRELALLCWACMAASSESLAGRQEFTLESVMTSPFPTSLVASQQRKLVA